MCVFFFFQAEDGIRDGHVTGVQTCALPISVDGVFTDKLVRQAFAYATDRKTAVETAFNGVTPFEPNAVLSRTTPSYNDSVADLYPYDPEEAEKLLDAAGWVDRDADGFRVKDGE